ncbi:MAG TPA: hypothetical protein DCZ75_17205 [Geobacter sp.]|nr:hypothetical protein [Geobacter sp.]
MSVNWKRFSFGAFLLASLSLLLFGCGDYSGSQTAQKSISGVVSGPDGIALEDAKVTAYAIGGNGATSSVPLSSPASVQSDNKGRYRLLIPADYDGSVMIVATKSASVGARLAKLLHLGGSSDVSFRAAIPRHLVVQPTIPPAMVSFATNLVVQYMASNNAGVFSPDNIQRASLVLEAFFGFNFTQTPPPSSPTDANTSQPQQDLLVSIQAINSFTLGSDAAVAAVVTALTEAGGIGTVADDIKTGIAQAIIELKAQGIIPAEYLPSASINTAISNAQFATIATPDLSDTTAPAAPTSLAVSGSSAKSVNLGWTLSTSPDVAGYLLYRTDATGARACIGAVAPDVATFSDFYAAPGATYSYVVVAYDNSRNLSDASLVVTVTTTTAADILPPTAPAGLICKGFDYGQVNLQWLPSSKTRIDGSVIPATRYNVYRDGEFVAFSTDTYFIDVTVSPSTSYTYFVKALDADGNLSAASPTVTVHTGNAPAAVLPQAPTGVAVTLASLNYNNTPLTWTASTTASTQPVTYNIYRDGVIIATGIIPTSYNDDSVTPNSSYVYTVTAVSTEVESLPTTGLTVIIPANPDLPDTAAPSVPTNLAAISVASNSVALAWAPSTKSSGDQVVAGYDILRGDAFGDNFVKVGTATLPSFIDTNNVVESTSYTYRVRSFSSAGIRSAEGLTISVATTAKIDLTDTTAPSAPAGLGSSSATATSVSLTWSASTETDLGGYLVLRDGAQIADVRTLIGFVDTTVAAGTSYVYTVKAYDNSGNLSAAGSAFPVTTPAAIPNSYTISGKVTVNGVGISGVNLSNGLTTAVSDVNGNYFFSALPAGTYTITPVATSFIQFAPVQRSVTISSSVNGQDFAATITGVLTGGVSYPSGTIVGGISVPAGAVIGGVTYPAGTVVGGITISSGTIVGGVFYPTGTVIGGVTYASGVVIGGVAYPAGTVVGGVAYPAGTVSGTTSYPNGTVSGAIAYPSGVVSGLIEIRPYVIYGRVTDSSSGLGLAGALVSTGSYQAETGPYGYYTLYVPDGTYTVGATLSGYTPGSVAGQSLNASQQTVSLDFVLVAAP